MATLYTYLEEFKVEFSPIQKSIAIFTAIHALLIFCVLVLPSSSQANANDWLNPSAIKTSLGNSISIPSSIPENRTCNETVFYSLEFVGQDETPTKKPKDVCVINGAIAQVGSRYLKPSGVAYGYPIRGPNGSSYTVAPSGNELIRIANTPSGNGEKYIYFHPSLAGAGSFAKNSNTKNMVFNYQNNDGITPYAPSGSPLAIREYAFSQNGEWMLVEASNIGFIRINMKSKEATQFTRRSFTYNMGASPYVIFAISNDGNSVISSSRGQFGPYPSYAYDLSGCSSGAAFVTTPTVAGCKEAAITSALTRDFSNYYSLSSVRFSSDGRSVESALHQRSGSTNTYNKISLSLDDIQQHTGSGYVALGDSFASGEGDNNEWYEEGTDVKGVNMCHLSKRSYPYLLSQIYNTDRFNSFACSGAVTLDINKEAQFENSPTRNSFGLALPGILPQVRLIKDNPDYVTVSIGGNDVDFDNKLKTCVAPGNCKYAADPSTRKNVAAEIAGKFDTLIETYQEIKTATDKKSKIYVIGYPVFVDDDSSKECANNVRLSYEERVFVKEATIYMNQVIAAAAKSAGVHYIDISNALKGYELCSEVPHTLMAFNGVTRGNDPGFHLKLAGDNIYLSEDIGIGSESFHPNPRGHKLMQQAIVAQLNGNPADFQTCPDNKPVCDEERQQIPEPSSYFGSESNALVKAMNGLLPISFAVPVERTILNNTAPGRFARLISEGFAANSQVRAEIHSDPTALGTYTADPDGTLSADITIPDSVAPGYHTINLYGTNIANEPVHYYQSVYLTGNEGDLNGNGVPDDQESCFFVEDSGIDQDQDGIDDACDPEIGDPPQTELIDGGMTPMPTIQEPTDPKPRQSRGETVAGNEPLNPPITDSTQTQSQTVVANNSNSPEPTPTTSVADSSAAPTITSATQTTDLRPDILGESVATPTSNTTKDTSEESNTLYFIGAFLVIMLGCAGFLRSYHKRRVI